MGLIRYLTSILLISMFAFAIISLSASFANNNSATINIDDDPTYSSLKDSLKTDTISFANKENDSNEAFAQIEIEGSGQTTPTGGQFKTRLTTPKKMLSSIFDSIRLKVFGGDSNFGVVLTVLFVFIVMIGILYVWKAWAGRNPD